jgi:hypothetical protein
VVKPPALSRVVTGPNGSASTGTQIPERGGIVIDAITILAVTLLVALLVIDRLTRT